MSKMANPIIMLDGSFNGSDLEVSSLQEGSASVSVPSVSAVGSSSTSNTKSIKAKVTASKETKAKDIKGSRKEERLKNAAKAMFLQEKRKTIDSYFHSGDPRENAKPSAQSLHKMPHEVEAKMSTPVKYDGGRVFQFAASPNLNFNGNSNGGMRTLESKIQEKAIFEELKHERSRLQEEARLKALAPKDDLQSTAVSEVPASLSAKMESSPAKKRTALRNGITSCLYKEKIGASIPAIRKYLLAECNEVLGIAPDDRDAVKALDKRISLELKKNTEGFFIQNKQTYSLDKVAKQALKKHFASLTGEGSTKKAAPKKSLQTSLEASTSSAGLLPATPGTSLKSVSAEEKELLNRKVALTKALNQLESARDEVLSKLNEAKSNSLFLNPRPMIFNNAYLKLSREALILLGVTILDSDIEDENKIEFSLTSDQTAKLVLISEFCNFFSGLDCVRLTRFSIDMLGKALLKAEVLTLPREVFFALLDLILDPVNLNFQAKNYTPENPTDANIYENLLVLDLYSILGLTTWQDILRRFILFCLTYKIRGSNSAGTAEKIRRDKLLLSCEILERGGYESLGFENRLDILVTLVEEANGSYTIYDKIEKLQVTLAEHQRLVSADTKDRNAKRKTLLDTIEKFLLDHGINVDGKLTKGKRKGENIDTNNSDTSEPISPSKKLKIKPLLPMLTIRNAHFEETDFTQEAFTKRLPKPMLAELNNHQKDLRAMQKDALAARFNSQDIEFRTMIRQEPLGLDSTGTEFFYLRSEPNAICLRSPTLDLHEKLIHKWKLQICGLEEQMADILKQQDTLGMRTPGRVKLGTVPKDGLNAEEDIGAWKWGFYRTKYEVEKYLASLNITEKNEADLYRLLTSVLQQHLHHLPAQDDLTQYMGNEEVIAIYEKENAETEAVSIESVIETTETFGSRPRRQCSQRSIRDFGPEPPVLKKPARKASSIDSEREAQMKHLKSMLESKAFERYTNRLSISHLITTAPGLFVLDYAAEEYTDVSPLDDDIYDSIHNSLSLNYEFNHIRLSRNLKRGEDVDNILSWIICELSMLTRVLIRNEAEINESRLFEMLSLPEAEPLKRNNVLGILDLPESSVNEAKTIILPFLDQFFEEDEPESVDKQTECFNPRRRLTRSQLARLSAEIEAAVESDHPEEPKLAPEKLFNVDNFISLLEELQMSSHGDVQKEAQESAISQETDDEEAEAVFGNPKSKSMSEDEPERGQMVTHAFCKRLIDHMLVIENLACSIIDVNTLKEAQSEVESDEEVSINEDFDSENEHESIPKPKKKKNFKSKKSAAVVENGLDALRKALEEFDSIEDANRFQPCSLVIDRDVGFRSADIIGVKLENFSIPARSILKASDPFATKYCVLLHEMSTEGRDSPELPSEVYVVSEEDITEGIESGAKQGVKSCFSAKEKNDLDRVRKFYVQLWGSNVKRELWLDNLHALQTVTTVSAVAIAVAQLSKVIYNPKTKSALPKKLVKKQYVPLIQ